MTITPASLDFSDQVPPYTEAALRTRTLKRCNTKVALFRWETPQLAWHHITAPLCCSSLSLALLRWTWPLWCNIYIQDGLQMTSSTWHISNH